MGRSTVWRGSGSQRFPCERKVERAQEGPRPVFLHGELPIVARESLGGLSRALAWRALAPCVGVGELLRWAA